MTPPLLACVLVGSLQAQPSEAQDPSSGLEEGCFEAVAQYSLPPTLQWPSDVRWAGDAAVFVSSPMTGVHRLVLGEDPSQGEPEIRRGEDVGGFWLPVHLASSPSFLVVGAPVFAVGWKKISATGLEAEYPFATVVDLDVVDDQLLILGARRSERGDFSPDGAIAWVGTLGLHLEDLRAVSYSDSGPGARPMDACGLLGLGAVRFLPDRSFIVVPGVEDGVYLYGPSGKLRRTWQATEIGFDAGCGLSDDEMIRLSKDEPARWAWVNQRRIVDEILALPGGTGFVVRTHQQGSTRWLLRILLPDGSIRSCRIPLTSSSGRAYLRADTMGSDVVLLVFGKGQPNREAAPETPPRLVVLRYRQ